MADLPKGEKFLPVDSLSYQDQGIVSRTILKKETGSVTLFAFDRGQELSEHSAPFDALAHILDGVAEISIAGEWHRLERGEMILLPANIPHALKAPEPFKMLLTMVRSGS